MSADRSPDESRPGEKVPSGTDHASADSADPVAVTVTDPQALERAGLDSTRPATDSQPAVNAHRSVSLEPVAPRHYKVAEELARGGMGRVLRAEDRRHGRPVAIKEMLRGDDASARRFQREALITARLQHPSIVPVYEAGTWPDGAPFYAMKLVEGTPLRDLIRTADSLADRLALLPNVLAVVEALAYAHSQNVVHRDLKPSNVIVGAYGETVVIDWGLAKLLDQSDDLEPQAKRDAATGEDLTIAGAVFGTPAYMAPEQSQGEAVDRRSDVYALGAILYHLLAGSTPYTGSSGAEILGRVRSGPPEPLSSVDGRLPADLVAIVSKAMARDPDNRYQSAKELADELRRFQTGQLVGAHRYSPVELVRRWLRKHRVAVVVAAVLLVALAVLAVVSVRSVLHERDRARRAQIDAEQARGRAETQRGAAENMVDFMLVDLSDRLRDTARLDMLEGITQHVQRYYEELGAQEDDDQYLERRERMLLLVGEVLEAKGDIQGTLDAWRDAAHVARTRVQAHPGNFAHGLRLVDIRRRVAHTFGRGGDKPAALNEYRSLQKMLDELSERHPDNAEIALVQVQALIDLGNLQFGTGDPESGLETTTKARTIATRFSEKQPLSLDWRRQKAQIDIRLADHLRENGQLDEALAIYDDMLGVARLLQVAAPRNKEVKFGVGFIWFKRSLTLDRKERREESQAGFRQALATFRELREAYPDDNNIRFFLAVTLNNLSDLLVDREREAAVAGYREAVQLLEPIADADSPWEWQSSLCKSYVDQASMLPAGDPSACVYLDRAEAVARRMREQEVPSHEELLAYIAQSRAALPAGRCPTTPP